MRYDDWTNEAVLNHIDPVVIGFINSRKHQIDFDDMDRWVAVSNIMNTAMTNERRLLLVKLVLNDVEAILFWEFVNYIRDFDANAFLKGNTRWCRAKTWDCTIVDVLKLCYALRDQHELLVQGNLTEAEFGNQFGHFLKFLTDYTAAETSIMGARIALSVMKLPCNVSKGNKQAQRSFGEFADRYKDLMFR